MKFLTILTLSTLLFSSGAFAVTPPVTGKDALAIISALQKAGAKGGAPGEIMFISVSQFICQTDVEKCDFNQTQPIGGGSHAIRLISFKVTKTKSLPIIDALKAAGLQPNAEDEEKKPEWNYASISCHSASTNPPAPDSAECIIARSNGTQD